MTVRQLDALYQSSRTHNGVFTTNDARLVGIGPDELTHLCSSGHVERVLVGVYRVPGAPRTPAQRAAIACSAFGGVASHRTAAALWGVEVIRHRGLDVSITGWPSRDLKGVTVHARRDLPPDQLCIRSDVACTTAVRTLTDLSAVTSASILRVAMEDCLRRKLTTPAELYTAADEFRGRGRTGTLRFRGVVEKCLPSGPTDSELEVLFELLVERYGLPEPIRHYPIPGVGTIDYAYAGTRVGFETDGWKYHWQARQWEADHEKTLRAFARGWHLHRLTWRMIKRGAETARTMSRLIARNP